jgi:chromosome segregation ATPase
MLIMLAIAPLLGLSSTAVVFAEGGTGTNTTTTRTDDQKPTVSSDDTTTTTDQTEDSSPAAKTELQTRLAKRKSELKTTLTAAVSARIKLRCKAAQGADKEHDNEHKQPLVARKKVYDNLVSKLDSLRDKLKAGNIDTKELDAEITALSTKIETFNTELAAMQQDRADLQAMDCATDPTAFKASLDAARLQREKVVKAAVDIRAYVKEVIKPTLVTLRAEVVKAKTPTTKTETEDNNGQ